MLLVLDELDGTYKVSYLLTVAGHYSILVAVRGKTGGVYVSVTGYPADASSPTFSGVALSQKGIPYAVQIPLLTPTHSIPSRLLSHR